MTKSAHPGGHGGGMCMPVGNSTTSSNISQYIIDYYRMHTQKLNRSSPSGIGLQILNFKYKNAYFKCEVCWIPSYHQTKKKKKKN